MRQTALAAAALFGCLLLIGCAPEQTSEPIHSADSPEATASEAPASPTPTPDPVITYTEPERSVGHHELGIPAYYTEVCSDENGCLYAFADTNGDIVFRTIGTYQILSDGVPVETCFAWYEAEADGSIASTIPIALEDESPGICEPLSLDGLRIRNHYETTEQTGVLRHSETGESYIYGIVGESEPAFYAVTMDGIPIEGALPTSSDHFLVSSYAPTTPPQKDGERFITVFIGSQSVAVFLAEDGDWTLEHVFICSTGLKKNYTPRGTFSITVQYEYKAMSELNGEMVYAQYASRFVGHILFHTVPTAGEYRNYLPNGRQQMLIAEYEKLGTPASHGCVRMQVGDCCWIYQNCKVGTKVLVTDDSGPEPPQRPALIYEEPYMDASLTYGWDPTDPDPQNPYLSLSAYAEALVVPTLQPQQSQTARPTKPASPKPTPDVTPAPTANE